jgi:hypothetical protein
VRFGNYKRGYRCPKCRSSKGEKSVRKWLDDNLMGYIEQCTFSDCKLIKLLRFDFYVPYFNAAIEFDGR